MENTNMMTKRITINNRGLKQQAVKTIILKCNNKLRIKLWFQTKDNSSKVNNNTPVNKVMVIVSFSTLIMTAQVNLHIQQIIIKWLQNLLPITSNLSSTNKCTLRTARIKINIQISRLVAIQGITTIWIVSQMSRISNTTKQACSGLMASIRTQGTKVKLIKGKEQESPTLQAQLQPAIQPIIKTWITICKLINTGTIKWVHHHIRKCKWNRSITI